MPAEVQDQVFQLMVIGPGAEPFRAGQKGRVLLRVLFLQKVLQHIGRKEPALGLVDLPEAGIQVDLTEIIAQKEGEKAVHGRDLGIVQEDLLPLQMGVGRIPLQSLRDRLPDPLPHLLRGGLGEGHDQEPVDIQGPVALADQADDPLDQNSRLAAAGGRRDQYVVVSCIEDLLLVPGVIESHIYLIMSKRPARRHLHRPRRAPSFLQSLLLSYPGIRRSNPQASRKGQ